MKKAIGGLLAVAVVAGAAPYVAGMQIEKEYRKLDQLNIGSGIELKIIDYNRGYTSSDIKLVLDLTNLDPQIRQQAQGLAEKMSRVEFAGKIFHGPLILAPQGVQTGMSKAVIYPIWSDDVMQKALKPIFGDQAPITLSVDLALDQSVRAVADIAPVTIDQAAWDRLAQANEEPEQQAPLSLNTQAMKLVVESDGAFTEVDSQLSVPAIDFSYTDEIAQEQMTLSLKGVDITQHQQRLDPQQAKGLWLGDASYKMDNISVVVEAPYKPTQNIKVESVSMISSLERSSGEELQLILNTDVKSAQLGPIPEVGPFTLNSSISKINGKLAQEMVIELQQIAEQSTNGQPDPQQLMGLMFTKVPQLLSNLQVDVTKLSLGTPEGTIDANAQVMVPQLSSQSLFDKQALIRSFEASVNLSVPKPLGDMPPANQVIFQLGKMGVETLDGENYKVDAQFKDGSLKINGVDLPFPG